MYRSMIQTRAYYLMNAGGCMGMVPQIQQQMSLTQWAESQMNLVQRAESQMNLVQRMERQMSLVLWAEREVGLAQRMEREVGMTQLIRREMNSASTAWTSQCCPPMMLARPTPFMGSPEQAAISDDESPAECQRDRVGFLGWDGRPRR